MIPAGYHLVETGVRVDSPPVAVSRFRWLAERRRRAYWGRRLRTAAAVGIDPIPSYRLEVVREGRWWVVAAFQNVLAPDDPAAPSAAAMLPWLGPGPEWDRRLGELLREMGPRGRGDAGG